MEIEVEEIMDEEEYITPFEASDIYVSTVERMYDLMVRGRIQLEEHNTPSYFLLDVDYGEQFRRLRTSIYHIQFKNNEETLYDVITGSSRCVELFRMARTNVSLLRGDSTTGNASVIQLTRAAVTAGRNILIPKGAKIVLHTEGLGNDLGEVSKKSIKEVSDETQVWIEDRSYYSTPGTRRMCFIGIDKEDNDRRI